MAKEPTSGQRQLMKKLKASQAKNMGERARKKISKDSGTLTSRIESVKKSAKQKGGLPAVRKESLPSVRKDNLPAKSDGGSRAIVKRESGQMVVREGKGSLPARADGNASSAGGGSGGMIRKMLPGAWRAVGGPAAMLVSMTTPAGEGSDKPPKYGMSLKEKAEREGGSVLKGGTMSNKDAEKQYRGIMSPTDYPLSQSREKAPVPKARPAHAEKPRAAEPRKSFAAKPKAAPKPSFRGNWVGAAPTEMQARGGARIKRRSLRDLIRGER